jgi:hypothetical protein
LSARRSGTYGRANPVTQNANANANPDGLDSSFRHLLSHPTPTPSVPCRRPWPCTQQPQSSKSSKPSSTAKNGSVSKSRKTSTSSDAGRPSSSSSGQARSSQCAGAADGDGDDNDDDVFNNDATDAPPSPFAAPAVSPSALGECCFCPFAVAACPSLPPPTHPLSLTSNPSALSHLQPISSLSPPTHPLSFTSNPSALSHLQPISFLPPPPHPLSFTSNPSALSHLQPISSLPPPTHPLSPPPTHPLSPTPTHPLSPTPTHQLSTSARPSKELDCAPPDVPSVHRTLNTLSLTLSLHASVYPCSLFFTRSSFHPRKPTCNFIPTHSLTHLPTHPLTHLPTHQPAHSPTYALAHSHTRPLTHSPTFHSVADRDAGSGQRRRARVEGV